MYGRRISFSGSTGAARSGRGRDRLSERHVVRVDRGRGRRLFRLDRLFGHDPIRGPRRQRPGLRVEPGRHFADLVDLAGGRRDGLLERGDEPLEIDLLVARGRAQGFDDLVGARRGRSLGRLRGLRRAAFGAAARALARLLFRLLRRRAAFRRGLSRTHRVVFSVGRSLFRARGRGARAGRRRIAQCIVGADPHQGPSGRPPGRPRGRP